MDLQQFACECCAQVKLAPEMEQRLEMLYQKLPDDPPRVAVGYRCEKRRKLTPWSNDPAHTQGRAVTFHTADQHYRHVLLLATLEAFEFVYIYPTRITVHVGEQPATPFCLVM